MIPENRLRVFNQGKGSGECVVYWMISARRTRWNHGLQHAIDLANERNLPLVVVEALAIAHQWANDRSHTFVIQGKRTEFAPTISRCAPTVTLASI